MQSQAPTTHPSRTLTLGRGWVLPASLIALILAGSYLPAHGVVGLLNIASATVARPRQWLGWQWPPPTHPLDSVSSLGITTHLSH